MSLFYHPLFREIVILVAILGLMVFCVDKSRQNRRTRNALYNCIYPLFAGAVIKGEQIIGMLMHESILSNVAGIVVVAAGLIIYGRFLQPQRDIPYNKLFYTLGWIVMGFLMCFLTILLYFSIRDHHLLYA
ncbi:MAG: hypothetical protein J5682_08020 [Prevotella sp.]|nr:hypothetical protein [Prevotella sp.]